MPQTTDNTLLTETHDPLPRLCPNPPTNLNREIGKALSMKKLERRWVLIENLCDFNKGAAIEGINDRERKSRKRKGWRRGEMASWI